MVSHDDFKIGKTDIIYHTGFPFLHKPQEYAWMAAQVFFKEKFDVELHHDFIIDTFWDIPTKPTEIKSYIYDDGYVMLRRKQHRFALKHDCIYMICPVEFNQIDEFWIPYMNYVHADDIDRLIDSWYYNEEKDHCQRKIRGERVEKECELHPVPIPE